MKKIVISLLTLLLISTVLFISNILQYKIDDDTSAMKEAIEDLYKRAGVNNQIHIVRTRDIDNYKLVLYENNNSFLGEAILKKGLNKKYKIDSTYISF